MEAASQLRGEGREPHCGEASQRRNRASTAGLGTGSSEEATFFGALNSRRWREGKLGMLERTGTLCGYE